MSAAEIAKAFGGAHRSGAWWRCRCPVHQSRGATLAVGDGERGMMVKCFGTSAVVTAPSDVSCREAVR